MFFDLSIGKILVLAVIALVSVAVYLVSVVKLTDGLRVAVAAFAVTL